MSKKIGVVGLAPMKKGFRHDVILRNSGRDFLMICGGELGGQLFTSPKIDLRKRGRYIGLETDGHTLTVTDFDRKNGKPKKRTGFKLRRRRLKRVKSPIDTD